ncbi:hypothetical protein MTO96_002200 [Rhipicephalus appendiculatus]
MPTITRADHEQVDRVLRGARPRATRPVGDRRVRTHDASLFVLFDGWRRAAPIDSGAFDQTPLQLGQDHSLYRPLSNVTRHYDPDPTLSTSGDGRRLATRPVTALDDGRRRVRVDDEDPGSARVAVGVFQKSDHVAPSTSRGCWSPSVRPRASRSSPRCRRFWGRVAVVPPWPWLRLQIRFTKSA